MSDEKLDINKITGTKDREKQAKILLNTINAPVVDLIIRYDSRTSKVSVASIGGNVPVDAVYKMLDMARDEIRKREIAAAGKTQEANNDNPAAE